MLGTFTISADSIARVVFSVSNTAQEKKWLIAFMVLQELRHTINSVI